MKWSVSHGSFLASSFLAIVIASILISIGWSSGSGNEYTYTVPIPEIKPQPELPISNSPTNISRKTIGLTGAPVTFVVYSDFQCSHCQSFALTIEKQLETTYVNTGKVLLEYRYIVAYGEESELAAEAAEAANEQGKFWPYHDLLMQVGASPKVEGDLSISVLQELAQQVGLDMELFNTSFQSRKYRDSILQESQNGMDMGVTSVPTFYINGFKKEGAKSFEELQVIIDGMLEGNPPDG